MDELYYHFIQSELVHCHMFDYCPQQGVIQPVISIMDINFLFFFSISPLLPTPPEYAV